MVTGESNLSYPSPPSSGNLSVLEGVLAGNCVVTPNWKDLYPHEEQ